MLPQIINTFPILYLLFNLTSSYPSPVPRFICFILTGIFFPWKPLLGISSKTYFQFFSAHRKQGKLGGQALTFKASWNIYPNWVLSPKMFAFLFLLSIWLEWGKGRQYDCWSWSYETDTFRGTACLFTDRALGVVTIGGCCGSFNSTIGKGSPPPCLFPTPPSPLYPDPGYQETTENQNVM